MYAQLIDDVAAKTLASASTLGKKGAKAKPVKKADAAKALGAAIAEKALALKVKAVVFDRGGFGFKGRVKALADGAREAGLKF